MNIVGESRAFEKSLDTREEEREEEKEAHGRLNSLEGGRGKGKWNEGIKREKALPMNRIKSVFVRNLVSGSLDTDSASSRGSIIPTRNYTIFATRANEDNGQTKRESHLDPV